jgi:photosystem II stability/assembly factor-like uncharacterized protein
MKISIRFAPTMMLLSLLFLSTISCKKETTPTAQPVVGKWLLYKFAQDANGDKKIDDAEWVEFTEDLNGAFTFLTLTKQVEIVADGSGKLVSSQSTGQSFKWRANSDGTFEIYDVKSPTTISVLGDGGKLYIDTKGDLIFEVGDKDVTTGKIKIGSILKAKK